MKENNYEHPDQYFRIDDVGDLHIQWMFDRYAAMRLMQKLPLFDRAYNLMFERKNFSRGNAFGEMHGDNYMWVEKSDHFKVIVLEHQNGSLIFIRSDYKFHIRELLHAATYPTYKKAELKYSKLNNFRVTKFYEGKNTNEALRYGDARDTGYLGTCDMLIKGHERLEHANSRILSTIGLIDFWEVYIDDPTELE